MCNCKGSLRFEADVTHSLCSRFNSQYFAQYKSIELLFSNNNASYGCACIEMHLSDTKSCIKEPILTLRDSVFF